MGLNLRKGEPYEGHSNDFEVISFDELFYCNWV